jgi:hypothetical protein
MTWNNDDDDDIIIIIKAHTWNEGEETLWKTKGNIKMILKKLLLLLWNGQKWVHKFTENG